MQKFLLSALSVFLFFPALAQDSLLSEMAGLPEYTASRSVSKDWLLDASGFRAGIYKGKGGKDLIISNGLIERCFRVSPNLGCYSFRNLTNGEEMLRAIKPEAVLILNGELIRVGGLEGEFEYGYTRYEWLDQFKAGSNDFVVTGFKVNDIRPKIDWTPKRWIPGHNWPPKGKEICFSFTSKSHPGIMAEVHYELFDGIPLISKWFNLVNYSG